MYEVGYALTRRLAGRSWDEVVARVRETLAAEGFGVLTEIDVQATLEKKLGVKRRPYLILGACNPTMANKALELEPSIGVLLPCNVDVFVGEDEALYVQSIDPRAIFKVVTNPAVGAIAGGHRGPAAARPRRGLSSPKDRPEESRVRAASLVSR